MSASRVRRQSRCSCPELHDIISCGASGLQRTALVAPINHYIRLCSFLLLGECSYHVSITSPSLQQTGSAIQNDYFQKLPNRARQAAHSLFMRAVSSALLRATAVIRHGRAKLPSLPALAAPFDRIWSPILIRRGSRGREGGGSTLCGCGCRHLVAAAAPGSHAWQPVSFTWQPACPAAAAARLPQNDCAAASHPGCGSHEKGGGSRMIQTDA